MPTATFADRARTYSLDLLMSFGRLALKRVHRTTSVVEAEYNSGHWATVLAEEPWRATASLEDYLVGRDLRPRLCKVEDKIVRLPARDYYRYRLGALTRLLTRHEGPTSGAVELGAGYGSN